MRTCSPLLRCKALFASRYVKALRVTYIWLFYKKCPLSTGITQKLSKPLNRTETTHLSPTNRMLLYQNPLWRLQREIVPRRDKAPGRGFIHSSCTTGATLRSEHKKELSSGRCFVSGVGVEKGINNSPVKLTTVKSHLS